MVSVECHSTPANVTVYVCMFSLSLSLSLPLSLGYRVHGVSIALTADEVYSSISHNLKELGMATLDPHDIVDITDDYMGGGYGTTSPDVRGTL